MAAQRKQESTGARARTRPQAEGDADAALLEAELVLRQQRSAPDPKQAPPTVGKTGNRGARAERPCEGSDRKQASAPPVEQGRRGKPPAETPKSSAAAGKPSAALRSRAGR
jgi:hypothetical protein